VGPEGQMPFLGIETGCSRVVRNVVFLDGSRCKRHGATTD
jgi:hypothetical protein